MSTDARLLPDRIAARLWERMASMYGHRWTSAYGVSIHEGAGLVWREALSDISPAQVATGIRACLVRADGWPPTLPEFRALCLEVPSLPSVQEELRLLLQQRIDGNDGSRFARFVASHLDFYDWRTTTVDKGARMVADAYEVACEHVLRGGCLPPDPAAAIEMAPPSLNEGPRSDPAKTAAVIDECNRLLGITAQPTRTSAEETA